MYRLVASPFLKINMAVAVVGYRTYPDAEVDGMVQDLEAAMLEVQRAFPNVCKTPTLQDDHIGICIMGHSSGAHLGLLMVVENARRRREGKRIFRHEPTIYIGISGVYNISDHFDFEAARGVEELSPMKPVNGLTRQAFKANSPHLRLQNLLLSESSREDQSHDCLEIFLPEILLVHGIEDSTVPFTSTSQAARVIRSCGASRCHEMYLSKTEHQQAVMELMLGGRTLDSITDWILKRGALQTCAHHSRL